MSGKPFWATLEPPSIEQSEEEDESDNEDEEEEEEFAQPGSVEYAVCWRNMFESEVEKQVNTQYDTLTRVFPHSSRSSPQRWATLLGMLRMNVLGCVVLADDGIDADEETSTAGLGLFAVHSMLNHSCSPNARCTSTGVLGVTVSAAADIQIDDQILVNYLPDNTHDERKQILLEQYGFACACEVCG